MKTYRVYVKSTQTFYLDVEAKNKDNAYDIAKQTDGAEFQTDDEFGTWEIQEDNIFEVESEE